MAVPNANTWGVIGSEATTHVAAELSGVLRIGQAPEPLEDDLGVGCCGER